jgi:hypothetical protein
MIFGGKQRKSTLNAQDQLLSRIVLSGRVDFHGFCTWVGDSGFHVHRPFTTANCA